MKFRAPTARLRGRVRYSFLDENDQPTYAHDQRGNRIWGGHWNSNLITDAGMDAVATDWLRNYETFDGSTAGAQEWRAYGHIGTGSTTPDVTDTVLDSEVMTSNSTGGFADQNTFNSPSGGVITAEYQITRVFTLESSQNLTEYGFSDDGGTLHIRELFRDESDNPITISIAAGKKLRLDHVLEISLPWGAASQEFEIEEYDASDTLVTTHAVTANCTFYATSSSAYFAPFMVASPKLGAFQQTRRFRTIVQAQSGVGPDDAVAGSGTVTTIPVANDEYTPGTHTIRQYGQWSETQANGDIYGFTVTLHSNPGGGFKVIFDDPATFTKADTHTIEFSIELSWARG